MNSIFVLGYGNPLRGDDGLGWIAADMLRQEWKHSQNVIIETAHQLTPEVVEDLSECQVALFLDVKAEGVPGEIELTEVKADHVYDSPLNHQCAPENLLYYTQQLYGKHPKVYVHTITGYDFGYKQSLSPIVEQSLPTFINQINSHILSYLKSLRV